MFCGQCTSFQGSQCLTVALFRLVWVFGIVLVMGSFKIVYWACLFDLFGCPGKCVSVPRQLLYRCFAPLEDTPFKDTLSRVGTRGGDYVLGLRVV